MSSARQGSCGYNPHQVRPLTLQYARGIGRGGVRIARAIIPARHDSQEIGQPPVGAARGHDTASRSPSIRRAAEWCTCAWCSSTATAGSSDEPSAGDCCRRWSTCSDISKPNSALAQASKSGSVMVSKASCARVEPVAWYTDFTRRVLRSILPRASVRPYHPAGAV